MNKLEAAFGKPYRQALENILTRMKTGRNKPFTSDSLAGRVTDWLNNSVGAIMFFNTRSAVLQTISSINFINWSDNNIYQAGKAFANQPQYWKDFKFLFNSDFLKERRGGLRFNVSESEIADAAKRGGARGIVSKILQAGFYQRKWQIALQLQLEVLHFTEIDLILILKKLMQMVKKFIQKLKHKKKHF